MSKHVVMTVQGPIEPGELGLTLSHEHLVIDLSCYAKPSDDLEAARFFEQPVTLENLYFVRNNSYGNRDNCVIQDIDTPLKELELFLENGGRSIVDMTLDGVGRNVGLLQEISKRTNINIIAPCGYYVQSSHPDYLRELSATQIAQKLLDEIKFGIGGTDIKPGIIGELGTSSTLHNDEIKVLRAAAMAQQETGLPISVHMHPPVRHAHRVLDILEETGADISRVLVCHQECCLTHNDLDFDKAIDHQSGILDRGCFIGIDTCGTSAYYKTVDAAWWLPSDRERAKSIAALCLRGYSKQILLSQDAAHRHCLTSYGGNGYAHVLSKFKETLYEADVSEYDVDCFLLQNPARFLTIKG